MKWEIPSYEEIKMDAEIGSYQEDTDAPDFPDFVEPSSSVPPPATAAAPR